MTPDDPLQDWITRQQAGHPQAALTDELVEVRALTLYRALNVLSEGGRKQQRQQAIASLRTWLGLNEIN